MKRLLGIVLGLSLAATAAAQDPRIETKTIELRQLKPSEAAKLLRPYIVNGGGGVYEVSDKLSIITIKDISSNISTLEQVLARYDRSPATIRLVFQLIEADTGPRVTAASNASGGVPMYLDSTLRSVLKFPSYKLLAQGISAVGEDAQASQQMGDAGEGKIYNLLTRVGSIHTSSTSDGTVNLYVQLTRDGVQPVANAPHDWIITTQVDVPLGNTVVLGTAMTRTTSRSSPGAPPTTKGAALILVVRTELVSKGK